MKKDVALVYMVAGISKRFNGRIKQFARVGPDGDTLIEYSLNQAIPVGFSKIIFIVGNKTEEPFKEKFGDNYHGIPITYALQNYNEESRDRPWGTCDALCSINGLIDCSFVVCNGDDIYGEESFRILYNHLQKNDNETATLGYPLINFLPEEGCGNRAIFKIKDGYVLELEEVFNIEKDNLEEKQLKAGDLCSMNIFALNPFVVSHLNNSVEKFKAENHGNREIECLIPAEISKIIKEGKIRMKVYPTDGLWLGVTKPEDEEKLRKILEERN